jgi:hypothetical protein
MSDAKWEDALAAKVASMTSDQRWARLTEIADSRDESREAMLEATKLFFGPEAVLAEE